MMHVFLATQKVTTLFVKNVFGIWNNHFLYSVKKYLDKTLFSLCIIMASN